MQVEIKSSSLLEERVLNLIEYDTYKKDSRDCENVSRSGC